MKQHEYLALTILMFTLIQLITCSNTYFLNNSSTINNQECIEKIFAQIRAIYKHKHSKTINLPKSINLNLLKSQLKNIISLIKQNRKKKQEASTLNIKIAKTFALNQLKENKKNDLANGIKSICSFLVQFPYLLPTKLEAAIKKRKEISHNHYDKYRRIKAERFIKRFFRLLFPHKRNPKISSKKTANLINKQENHLQFLENQPRHYLQSIEGKIILKIPKITRMYAPLPTKTYVKNILAKSRNQSSALQIEINTDASKQIEFKNDSNTEEKEVNKRHYWKQQPYWKEKNDNAKKNNKDHYWKQQPYWKEQKENHNKQIKKFSRSEMTVKNVKEKNHNKKQLWEGQPKEEKNANANNYIKIPPSKQQSKSKDENEKEFKNNKKHSWRDQLKKKGNDNGNKDMKKHFQKQQPTKRDKNESKQKKKNKLIKNVKLNTKKQERKNVIDKHNIKTKNTNDKKTSHKKILKVPNKEINQNKHEEYPQKMRKKSLTDKSNLHVPETKHHMNDNSGEKSSTDKSSLHVPETKHHMNDNSREKSSTDKSNLHVPETKHHMNDNSGEKSLTDKSNLHVPETKHHINDNSGNKPFNDKSNLNIPGKKSSRDKTNLEISENPTGRVNHSNKNGYSHQRVIDKNRQGKPIKNTHTEIIGREAFQTVEIGEDSNSSTQTNYSKGYLHKNDEKQKEKVIGNTNDRNADLRDFKNKDLSGLNESYNSQERKYESHNSIHSNKRKTNTQTYRRGYIHRQNRNGYYNPKEQNEHSEFKGIKICKNCISKGELWKYFKHKIEKEMKSISNNLLMNKKDLKLVVNNAVKKITYKENEKMNKKLFKNFLKNELYKPNKPEEIKRGAGKGNEKNRRIKPPSKIFSKNKNLSGQLSFCQNPGAIAKLIIKFFNNKF